MQAFIDQDAVLCLLLVFIIKIIGSYWIGRTLCLLTQLTVPFNGLIENTHNFYLITRHFVKDLNPENNLPSCTVQYQLLQKFYVRKNKNTFM